MRKVLFAVSFLMACLLRADAQILVYDLSFNTTGPSVNYSFLEGGYLVVDVSAQSVTSVVILTDPTTQLQYYTTGLLSGTYMEMLEEGSGSEYAVIYSNSGSAGGENIAFQILGKTSNNTGVGGGNSLSIAKKLRGYLLASAAESLTTGNTTATSATATSGNSTFSYGFAGSSKVTANLQSGLTSDSNSNRWDAAAALDNLTQVLENRGIFSESSQSSNSTTSSSTTTLSTTSNSTSSQ